MPHKEILQQDARRHLKYLKDLTKSVKVALSQLDAIIVLPSIESRGKKIAAICNLLDMTNDMAIRFGLGVSLKKKGKS